ncbi:MAG: DNA-protecting protein DprA [Candidatus Marsarchaeota archaeon]|nr:DNA-protecting protein DprA [Candidatus Marsarchaeota archaeon]
MQSNNLSVENLIMWFKLTLIRNGFGPARIIKLLNYYFNDLEKIFNLSNSDLFQSGLMTKDMISNFEKLKNANNDNFYQLIEVCKMNDINIIPLLDSRYPQKLKIIPNPPLTLYVKGNLNLLQPNMPKIAIVGTREPSIKAKTKAYEEAKILSNNNITIISGGALGIDTAAYEGVLDSENKQAIIVLGAGILHPYPPENKNLFDEIVKNNGLLISENTPSFTGTKISYVQRNRITSGLANFLYLIAASATGGGFQQAKIAYNQRRPIFVPELTENILPNDGIKRAINEFAAKEIKSSEIILQQISNQPAFKKHLQERLC